MMLFREGAVFHLEAPGGNDYTLCGAALEGERGDSPMEEISDSGGRQVTCAECIRIVEHCWRLRKSKIGIAMPNARL